MTIEQLKEGESASGKQYALVDGELCVLEENEFISTWKKIDVPKLENHLYWNNHQITLEVWERLCAFFRKSYEKNNSESFAWLYFHPELGWEFVVPYQKSMGMTVDVTKDERNDKLREELPDNGGGWIQFGTIHDHCSGSAGQSSVDAKDEEKFDGLHITLGHLDKDELDIATRFTWQDVQYTELDISAFIERPDIMNTFPESTWDTVHKICIKYAGLKKATVVPKELLDRVEKKIISGLVLPKSAMVAKENRNSSRWTGLLLKANRFLNCFWSWKK